MKPVYIIKASLILLIVSVIAWIYAAHLNKWAFQDAMEELNSDNVKLSYENISIVGFPFVLGVELLKPKFTIIGPNKFQELRANKIRFEQGFNSGKINLGKAFKCYESELERENKFTITSARDLVIDLGFNKIPAFRYKPGILLDSIILIGLKANDIKILNNGESLAKLDNIDLTYLYERQQDDIYNIRIKGKGFTEDPARVKIAELDMNIKYFANEYGLSFAKDFHRKVDIQSLNLILADSAFKMGGDVNLSRTGMPVGQFDINITQYHQLVDLIVSEDFVFSQSYIKNIISKANNMELTKEHLGNAAFKVRFSDKGIALGNYYIIDSGDQK